MPADQPTDARPAPRHRNRGKRKATLRDLRRVSLSYDELRDLLRAAASNPPAIAAIFGASLLEHEIERLIRSHFKRQDDETWNDLTGENGPLHSFNAKIL